MKRPIYKKYFLCFLSILLIPLLSLGTFLSISSIKTAQTTLSNKPNQAFAIFNQEFISKHKQIQNVNSFLSNETLLLQPYQTLEGYNKYTIIKKLQQIKEILGFCSDVAVYYPEEKRIIGANGEVADFLYFESNEFLSLLENKIREDKSSFSLPYSSPYTTLFTSFFQMKDTGNAYLLFSFAFSQVSNVFPSLLAEEKGSVFLFSEEQEDFFPIYQWQPRKNQEQGSFSTETMGENGFRYKEYFYFPFRLSPKLQLYIKLPTDALTQSVKSILLPSLIVIVAAVFLGFVMVVFFTRYNYRPISELKQSVSSYTDTSKSGDELSHIHSAFSSLTDKVSDLSHSFDSNRENLLHSIVARLLYQQYASPEILLEDLAFVGIKKLYPYYAVLVIAYKNAKEGAAIYQYLSSLEVEETQLFSLRFQGQHQNVLIINTQEEDRCSETSFHNLHNILFNKLALETTIGYSSCTKNFSRIPSLFEEAQQALSYSFISGKYTVISSDFLQTKQPQTITPFDFLELEHCVIGKDEIRLLDIFTKKLSEIQQSKLPLHSVKIYLFDMITNILAIAKRLEIDGTNELETLASYAILETQSLEELFNQLYYVVIALGKNIQINSSEAKIERINSYLHANYYRYDFSIGAVSDYFNLSLSTLSQFYKNETGINISDYIDTLRIEKAKNLLTQTDKTVQDIVKEVGYVSPSSFIRKFRILEGVTPGQYRVIHNLQ